MGSLIAIIISVVGLTVGSGGVLGALSARKSAREAQASAIRALQASPAAIEHQMRQEIDELAEAYELSSERHRLERAGMEKALNAERARAELAEGEVFQLHASMAGLRLDLAAARAEVSDLRSRFEEFVANR